jgi:hypothetical protein
LSLNFRAVYIYHLTLPRRSRSYFYIIAPFAHYVADDQSNLGRYKMAFKTHTEREREKERERERERERETLSGVVALWQ